MRSLYHLLIAIWLLAAPVQAAQNEAADPQSLHNQAITAFYTGKIQEAKALLAKLLERHPDFYRGYELYWDAVGRTEDAAARHAAIERSLKQFDQTPPEKRVEDYYNSYIHGCEALGDNARAEAARKEAIAKFPRGLISQIARLDAAREEKDPAKSARLNQAYIDEFNDNVSWAKSAAGEKFKVVSGHADSFDAKALLTAAEQFERLSKRYVEMFGDPYSYVVALHEIAEGLSEKDPASSLSFARKALVFIQENWLSANQFHDRERAAFWPAMMRANNALKNWGAARRLGEALTRELENGLREMKGDSTGLSSILLPAIDEAGVRRDYARALEEMKAVEAAREQLAWAATLDDKLKGELDAFFARHSMGREERARFEASLAARMNESLERRFAALKREVLATEERRPAGPFALKDLSGKTVSLADFRGKVLVLEFWATWCGPCNGELEEMKVAYDKYRQRPDVAVVAISIDNDKAAVAPHAQRLGYQFQILLSDGEIEAPYRAQGVPQLYIVDPAGDIRFHHSGYLKDGFYLKKLDWMIEAALK